MATQALRGRRNECETLDRLLGHVRAGESRALVVRGEPGVGKTALLEYTIESAPDFRVARAFGVESEMELAFAALQQLCAPMLDGLERLPTPQRAALATAFGLSAGGAPDRLLVGLAALSLLSEVAEEQPLLCLVDDAQWLDRASAQALAFVARRLLAESVTLVFATREPNEAFMGVPELVVEGLGDADARALLGSVVPGPLDAQVRERFVAETHGNPLALLELSRSLTPAERAGGLKLPDTLPLAGRIEENFRRRLEALPAATRRLLLIAAAEPVGEPTLVWRAAERLGIGAEALAAAEADGLLEIGARVRFRHPLVRSAAYRAASSEHRREVHRALAEATNAEVDPDRRAWHLAEATAGPDEHVAAELERAAGRAQSRGGLAAAAAFLERATVLTLEPALRVRRALAAAQALYEAGLLDDALALLAAAEAGAGDPVQRARAQLLRAQIAFTSRRGSDAPPLLLKAARDLEAVDVDLSRATYLEALSAAFFAGRLARGGSAVEISETSLAGPQAPQPPRPSDLLLDGLAIRFTEGDAAAAPILKQALSAFRRETLLPPQEARWLWLAGWVAADVWDDETWTLLSVRQLQLVREAGALTAIPLALSVRSAVHAISGELTEAASLIEEIRTVIEATGIAVIPYTEIWLAALRGQEAALSELLETTAREALPRGEGFVLASAEFASAVLYNGLGRYDAALAAVRHAGERTYEMGYRAWTLPELIEAAVRCRERQPAGRALERLSDTARASGTQWALGIEARSRALLSDGDAAESLYREAIERLGRTRVRVELARAHLLYGEWLRRDGRRVDAREQLRTADDMFTTMGVKAFAERAARELVPTGERARKRSIETRDDLTAQEAQIARLARDGLSNPDIGTRLFLSPRTVEYHLHKVFAKLDINSREHLGRVLPKEPNAAQPD